jgi:hypothetical protein
MRGQRCVNFFFVACMLTSSTYVWFFEYPVQNKERWFWGFVLIQCFFFVFLFTLLNNRCLPSLSSPMNHHDHRCDTDRGTGA